MKEEEMKAIESFMRMMARAVGESGEYADDSSGYRALFWDPAESGVDVEVRVWRPEKPEHGAGLAPTGVPARLTAHPDEGPPLLVIEGNDEFPTIHTAEETLEFMGVLMVKEAPGTEELRLLTRAVASGFAVEPYVAGERWRAVEGL